MKRQKRTSPNSIYTERDNPRDAARPVCIARNSDPYVEIQSLAFHVVSNGRIRFVVVLRGSVYPCENDREPDQPHEHLNGDGGSLADEYCAEELAAWVEHGRDSPGPSG
jgi:hypothetical protein